MRSKNKPALTKAEAEHLEAVKSLMCSVCDAPPPSEAHHLKQDNHYSAAALCYDCHRGSRNGWHGNRCMWDVKKMDEVDALCITYRRLLANCCR